MADAEAEAAPSKAASAEASDGTNGEALMLRLLTADCKTSVQNTDSKPTGKGSRTATVPQPLAASSIGLRISNSALPADNFADELAGASRLFANFSS